MVQASPSENDSSTNQGIIDDADNPYDAITLFLRRYIFPIIVCLGLFNNVLIVVVMSMRRYRNIVSCFYLKALAVFDFLTLLMVTCFYIDGVMPTLAATLGHPFCAAIYTITFFTINMSSWSVVLVTFARLIAVVFPLKANQWCTFRSARISLAILIITFASFASPSIVYGRAMANNFGCELSFSIEVSNLYNRIHTFLSQFVPFILLFLFNLCIVYKLKIRKVDLGQMNNNERSKDDAMVMTMVIVVTIVFMVLLLPYAMLILVTDYVNTGQGQDHQYQQLIFFLYNITSLPYSFNSSINLYLYCICARNFRNDLYRIIMCRVFSFSQQQ